MSDVCRHGWTKINYNACPRCRDDALHAEEIARLTAALASSQAEVEEVKGRLAFALESAMEWQTQALGAISERDAALQRAEGWEEEARTYAQNATFQREQRESAESRAADLAKRLEEARDVVVRLLMWKPRSTESACEQDYRDARAWLDSERSRG